MDRADAAALGTPARRRATARVRSDAALVRPRSAARSAAVEELFARHWAAAHRAAYWVTHDAAAAEDIAQEAFLAALRALDRFDRRRPFRPWLHRVVVNRAIDHARARALRREVGAEVLEVRAVADAGPADRELLAALAALPPDQRAASSCATPRPHAGGDRGHPRPPARDGELAAAARARRARRPCSGRTAMADRLSARLRHAPVPDAAAAEERARRVVLAAVDAREPARRALAALSPSPRWRRCCWRWARRSPRPGTLSRRG